MSTIRNMMIATAFSAGVAGILTGAALSVETQEINAAEACESAHWPMIPTACLDGAPAREVRNVTAKLTNIDQDLQERFATAFQ